MSALDELATITLPFDVAAGALVGRVWRPEVEGPAVVAIRGEEAVDISRTYPTVRDLCESSDPAAALEAADGESVGRLDAILANTPADRRDPSKP